MHTRILLSKFGFLLLGILSVFVCSNFYKTLKSEKFSAMTPIYGKECLLNLRQTAKKVSPEVWNVLNELGIKKTYRGTRSGKKVREYKKSRTVNMDSFNIGLFNARSAKNKTLEIADHITDHGLDVVALTETWLGDNDAASEGELCPPGYVIYTASRKQRRGGGVALIIRSSLHPKLIPRSTSPKSFEYIESSFKSNGKSCTLVVVYRPPPNSKNKLTVPQFIDEFADFLEKRVADVENLCIVGDFNFHIDVSNDPQASMFLTTLEAFGLVQHVVSATHCKGHLLDLIITRSRDNLVASTTVHDILMSDHHWIHSSLLLKKPKCLMKTIQYRKLKCIDLNQMSIDINDELKGVCHSDVASAVDHYNNTLSQVLDTHAPLKSKSVVIHPEAPFYNDELDKAKKVKRASERKWRKTKLEVHRQIYIEKRNFANNLLASTKETYYLKKISDASDQKSLFQIVNTLLNRVPKSIFPTYVPLSDLPECFAHFFSEKINIIRRRLDQDPIQRSNVIPNESNDLSSSLLSFVPTTELEVQNIIMQSKATTCRLDPFPSKLLKVICPTLSSYIASIINMSFEQVCVPSVLKCASVIPLIKKQSLDPDVLKNYRPVSNLPFLSKVMERVVAKRLTDYMDMNNLQPQFQSAYRKNHSVETALLRVQSDILTAIDKKQCVLLILLDLSAAFDTIDHDVLLSRLNSYLGVSGDALKWFHSYLKNRKQSISLNDNVSEPWELLYGVPQGSVLGPLLFSIYIAPLGQILKETNVSHHFYADDTQLYVTFQSKDTSNAVTSIENTLDVVKLWMTSNFLCLNDDKTEVILISSNRTYDNLSPVHLKVGTTEVIPTAVARNIGVHFDCHMSLKNHIVETTKSAWFHLRNISKIRNCLDNTACERLIHAFVTSKLDLNNSLYFGLPEYLLQHLQHIQNAAARILTRTPKHDHITPVLKSLHWLPITYRIEFKINIITFKALHGLAPVYISDLITQKPTADRSMRSDDKHLLVVPFTRTKTYGDRSFSHCSPALWNVLPVYMKCCDNFTQFKSFLKTHLFEKAFPHT